MQRVAKVLQVWEKHLRAEQTKHPRKRLHEKLGFNLKSSSFEVVSLKRVQLLYVSYRKE